MALEHFLRESLCLRLHRPLETELVAAFPALLLCAAVTNEQHCFHVAHRSLRVIRNTLGVRATKEVRERTRHGRRALIVD